MSTIRQVIIHQKSGHTWWMLSFHYAPTDDGDSLFIVYFANWSNHANHNRFIFLSLTRLKITSQNKSRVIVHSLFAYHYKSHLAIRRGVTDGYCYNLFHLLPAAILLRFLNICICLKHVSLSLQVISPITPSRTTPFVKCVWTSLFHYLLFQFFVIDVIYKCARFRRFILLYLFIMYSCID